MARSVSSNEGSPLSSLSSEPFDADDDQERTAEAGMPPAKRQRIGNSSMRATPPPNPPFDEVQSCISSDTDGEFPMPSSPNNTRPDDDDNHEQVTVCVWDGCEAGDLGDMDALVEHIHNEHIETRQKKYTCEWSDCTRKSMTHASGYALKAHMRSHTREKPFLCSLPECDRAFTRSDALAKHLRTVHEIEALRPSDPIPKSMQTNPTKPTGKLKLIFKASAANQDAQQSGPVNGTTNGNDGQAWLSSFPPELGFTLEEEARGSKELYRLLRRQVHWAEEEAELLKASLENLESLRKDEWVHKELLLEQTISTEISWHERRKEVLAGLADIPTDAIKATTDLESAKRDENAMSTSPAPLRAATDDQKEAASVLASMHET